MSVPLRETNQILVSSYKFERVVEISPVRTNSDEIQTYLPQDRYTKAGALPLNNYGAGPFCKFSIPSRFKQAGVYIITVDGLIQYVGECVNLSRRFNMGYGNISPRNCFKRGQETNWRLNAQILDATSKGASVELWFHPTDRYKLLELELRAQLSAQWNRA